jgi:hypothetical protein
VRALYHRKKGRDLFDLAIALQQDGVDPERIAPSCRGKIAAGPLKIPIVVGIANEPALVRDDFHSL